MRTSIFVIFVLLCAILLDDAIVLAKKNKQESQETHYDDSRTKNAKKDVSKRNEHEPKKNTKKERKQDVELTYDDSGSSEETNYSDKRQKRQTQYEKEDAKAHKRNKRDKHSMDDGESSKKQKQKQKSPKKPENPQQVIEEEETNEETPEHTCECPKYTDENEKGVHLKKPREFPCEKASNGDIDGVKIKQRAHKEKNNPPGYYSRPKTVDESGDGNYEKNDFCSRCSSECYKRKQKKFFVFPGMTNGRNVAIAEILMSKMATVKHLIEKLILTFKNSLSSTN